MRKKFLLSKFLVLLILITGSVGVASAQIAKIDGNSYSTFADALTAANGMTGDVTVEIYEKVTLNSSLSGSYSSIKFVGNDTDAEIYLDVQGYITATGKKVAFEDLTLSKSAGGFITNAGFMNVAFGVYDVTEVTYTRCNFANGAYAGSGVVTYIDCTFKRSHEKYGLWAYGNVDVTVYGGKFDDYRGIKMYAEGAAKTVDLTVQNVDFSAVSDKPAIVLTYGESVTLEGNTYSSTGTFELDLDGQPNGTAVTSDVAPTCKNDNGACGVLCDGKIYTTVAEAAEVATPGSTVTLLHNSTETVTLPVGVTLDTNGYTADGVTEAAPVEVSTYDELVAALANGGKITLTADITVDTKITAIDGTEIDLNDKTLYVNVENSYYNNVTIKNGNVVLGKDDVHVCDGYFNVAASKTLVLDGVNMSSSAEGIKGYAVFHLYTGANLDLINSTLNISDNEYSAGYIVYAGEATATVDVTGTTITGSKVNGIVHATTVIDNSTLTLTNVIEHGINRSGVTIDDSNVTISGGTGRGITAQHGPLNITGNSVVSISEMGEATIELRNNQNLTVAETATVTVDAAVNNTTSGTITGNITVNGSLGKVAKVGDTYYKSLQEAIDACEGENNVITLLSDLTFESDLNDAGKGYFNIADGRKVVLDMNGKTINVTDNSTGNFIVFYNYGEFTVANGTINLNSTNDRDWNAESAIFLNRGGIFNIENGTYTHNGGTDMAFVVDNSGNYFGDATTNIYEKTLQRNTVTTTLTSSYIAIRNRMEQNTHGASGEAILNVYGGTISGTSRAIWAQAASTSETAPAKGKINVEGGNIGLIDTPRSTGAVSMTTISGGTVSAFKGEAGELTVTGGTLNEVTLLTAAGETVNDYAVNEDGLYVQAVAKIGETKYADLQEAIKAAAPAGTVEILSDVTVDKWIMISETLNISSGQIITMNIDGLTINGNGKTVTIKSIESAGNGNRLFYDATKLNINNWTIKYADGVAGGIGLTSGTINKVTIEGGAGVFPGTGNITISECNFKTSGHCIYFEEERDNLVVTNNTFELPADANVILLRGDVKFTDNTVVSGRTVNVVSGSPVVSGNKFNNVRFKVYNAATATISENTINNLVFNETDVPTESTFTDNTLSAEAQAAIDALPALAGEGTEANPYLINDVDDLVWLQEKVDELAQDGSTQFAGKYFKLTNNIDLSGINWNPIGTMNVDHGSFKGVFDGGNYTISNLYVEQAGNGIGLFARTAGNAVIKNLKLNNVTVKSTDNSNYVGGLVGNAYASTKIENVHVSGNVYISGRGYIGGIAGHGYVVMDNVSVVATGDGQGNTKGLITSTFWCAGGVLGYAGEGATNIMNAHVENVVVTSAAGGLGAIVGMAEDNNGTQPISGSNLSAKNVEIKTYTGAYGDSYANYALGYLYGGNPTSILTGELSVEEVTIETSTGVAPEVNDAVAQIGNSIYFNLQDALNAAVENETITLLKDIKIAERTVINNRTLTIDGNGKTIRQDENFDNTIAMFDITGGKVTINNVIFDGVKKGAVVRTVGTEFAMDNVTAQNSVHTVGQGLFRLVGQNTITNSKFLNNNCSMVITLNYDGESNTPQLVKNCLFEGNECNSVAALYYVKGAGCTIKDSEFVENTVNCNNNGATVYLGFTENNVVTGNIFDSNNVIDASTSTRVAGAIFFGYEAEIENNVFVGNTASNANNDVLGQICTSTFYDCTIDLSGNYWGGEAPEYGKDYTIQHTASEHQGVFQLDNYYKTFTTDENGNVELGDKVNIDYVAQVGKFSYETLADAFAAAENNTITLLIDTELSEMITIPNGKTVVLDLNGKTITGKDNTTKNFSIIDNRGNLTITDSSDPSTGKITLTATTNSGWNRYSAVIANNPGGKLTIEAGTIQHLGGTDMAYGIDNLTNGKGTYAETVINGGTIKSTYRAIRQFLNGIEAQNILKVNGGTIEGTNKSIWMQDPSANANTGTLTVGEEANLIGNVYLYVTPNSTSWPVEVSIAAEALAEGSEVMTGNVPAGYELKLVDGVYSVCSVEAKIGEVTYATLAAAVNAANEGDTITLVTDITFTEATRTHNSGSWYDGLYYIGDKSFTIDLASYTIGHDNSVNDYLLNFKNNGAKANVINLINGTIEAGSTAYCALATSSSNTNKITINTENINIINNNSNGSTIKVRGGVELNVNAGTVITGKDSYLGIECVASTVNIYDDAEIYMNGSTSYNGCLVGACANGTVNVYGGYGEGVKGGFIAMTSGGTINVAGGEWIANTDGTVGDNSNLYVLTAQNNKNESGYAGASIINVTGGTFRGGMDAWILNDANVEKAELNISGGNFNADPTSYVVSNNYKVVNEDDGTYTVEVDGFEKFYTVAGEETTSDNAAYSLMFTVTDYANNEVSVKISKKPAQNSSINLVTPVTATFDGITFNVTSVADNGFNSTRFKTVTISEGVATIGTKALANMSALTDIVFPSTLKSIGDNCFYGYGENHKIKTITCYAEEAPVAASHYTEVPFQMVICKVAALIVPNAVSYEEYATAPGWSRFYEEPNGGLINHILGIGTELEIAGKDDKYTMIATVTSIEPMECSIQIGNTKPASNSNAELVIPEVVDFFPSVEGLDFTVTSIPNNAFSSCLYFVGDLVIPQNVRTIGASAFNTSHFVANETVRGTLTLNEGLVSIGSQAFKKDNFKGDLSIPSTVETIASNAFQYASFDGILTINGNIDCANAFGGTGFTELVLVEGIEEIKDSNAFSGMLSLKEVVLPSTLQTVGMAAFKDDDAIEVIHTYATEVPAINSITGNVNYKYAFSETVKANAVLYVHGTSYDDVLKYKNATNEWKEFQNIHLYGAVAQIEEVEHLTIQDAINAAQAGETITVIDNVELTETITVAAGKEVVLDLNGKVVSYTTTEYVGEAMITNNGNLTINDSAEGGKLSYAYEGGANSSYGFGNSTIENKGVLTINACTVENTSAAMSHASYAINTGAGATLNVEDGNILNLNGHAVRMVSFGTELNTVNINGGYIEGTRALQVQLPGSASSTTKPAMDLNITGGELMSNEETYNLAIYVFSNGQSAENVSVEISGGTFNGNVAVNAAATNSMLANAVAITGGTFNGDYGVFSYSDEDAAQAVISITGGTFATNYSEWYAEDEQYVFELNENGTYSVVEQTIFTQTTQLSAGWNWFSAYVDIENNGLSMIQNELGTNGLVIKKQGDFSTYDKDLESWFGTFSISNKETILINVTESQELTIVGEIVNPEDHTIILNSNNWNWIGYPLNTTLLMSEAFEQAGLTPSDGDVVKYKDNFASYLYIDESIKGWIGDFDMNPGEGFMYKNNSEFSKQLTYKYPTNSNNRSETRANVTTEVNHWTPNASQYPNNMTMMAMVDIEGGDYEVAAFVDGEVRGSARPIYVEPIDAYVLLLTIHGEGVEEMTFKFYDLTTGEEFDLNDRMNYSDNAIVGSIKEPYMFKRGTTGIGEAAMSEVNIYPNPTTTGTEINLQATCDKVEVFNALGVKVAEYQNVDTIDALETAGIYVIRITNNGNVQNCRLVVK